MAWQRWEAVSSSTQARFPVLGREPRLGQRCILTRLWCAVVVAARVDVEAPVTGERPSWMHAGPVPSWRHRSRVRRLTCSSSASCFCARSSSGMSPPGGRPPTFCPLRRATSPLDGLRLLIAVIDGLRRVEVGRGRRPARSDPGLAADGPGGRLGCGARPVYRAAKWAGAATIGGRGKGRMPDRDAHPPDSENAGERDRRRRLLDGYAAPDRLRRLKDRQRRQQAGRHRRLRRWLSRLLRWRSGDR